MISEKLNYLSGTLIKYRSFNFTFLSYVGTFYNPPPLVYKVRTLSPPPYRLWRMWCTC